MQAALARPYAVLHHHSEELLYQCFSGTLLPLCSTAWRVSSESAQQGFALQAGCMHMHPTLHICTSPVASQLFLCPDGKLDDPLDTAPSAWGLVVSMQHFNAAISHPVSIATHTSMAQSLARMHACAG